MSSTPDSPTPKERPEIKLFESIHAGFPSPAEDIPGTALDINKLVVKNPASTFFARVSGDSMVHEDGSITLQPSNPKYRAITVREGDDLAIWGTVRYVIKKV